MKWKIYDIFYVSLLEQDTTKMGRVETSIELEKDNSKEYEFKAICDSEIYGKKSDCGHHLLGFYYLVLWKSYPEKENT